MKLLDFGLARPLAEQLRSDMALTEPGTIVGTPRYMSPEQWEGEPLGPPSDLFAVGALLFEMLAGKPAFPGETIIEVSRAVAIAEPPALTGGPEVMAADRIIQLALAKRPSDRYPDAAAMARDVRDARAILGAGFHDPEGLLLHVRELAHLGLVPEALELLQQVVRGGYHCPTALTRDPWLDALRGEPEFVRLVRQAEAGSGRAAELYTRAGGERVLGVGTG